MQVLKTKSITVPILILAFFISNCSGDDASNTTNTTTTNDANNSANDSTGYKKKEAEMDNVAKEICNCFADFERSISAAGKKILIDNANRNIEYDPQKLNENDRQLFSTKGREAYNCSKSLEKKYPIVFEDTPETTKLYNEALKRNCSAFVAAVMMVK